MALSVGWCFLLCAACGREEPVTDTAALQHRNLPPYAAHKLSECLHDVKTISESRVETASEEASLHELTRLIATTTKTYYALNHHVFGWNTTMEHLYLANREAVRRGVEVIRIIILSDEVLNDPELFRNALDIMDLQQRDGIKVFYGLQRELEQEPAYQCFLMLDAGLSDDRVYATVKAVSPKGPQPAQVVISWEPDMVRKNPFSYLRQSRYIYPYSEQARQHLLQLAAVHQH